MLLVFCVCVCVYVLGLDEERERETCGSTKTIMISGACVVALTWAERASGAWTKLIDQNKPSNTSQEGEGWGGEQVVFFSLHEIPSKRTDDWDPDVNLTKSTIERVERASVSSDADERRKLSKQGEQQQEKLILLSLEQEN